MERKLTFTMNGDDFKVLCYDDGRIVASAFGVMKEDQFATLDTLQVDLCERGTGHGSRILDELKKQAMSLGCRCIEGDFRPESDPQMTESFYKKNGFLVDLKTGKIRLELQATTIPSEE